MLTWNRTCWKNRVCISLCTLCCCLGFLGREGQGQTSSSNTQGLSNAQGNSVASGNYDPLHLQSDATLPVETLSIHYPNGKREVPVRIYQPNGTSISGVILFSHGLGGTNQVNAFLASHWSSRGYVCVFLQHPGSDESVWRGKALGTRMDAMRGAASGTQFTARIEDVHVVLDQLEQWDRDPQSKWKGRFPLEHVGMSGHSFGAITTQAVSGQNYPLIGQKYLNARIDAALLLSPSPPAAGSVEKAFDRVPIPWMLMTGTRDSSTIGVSNPQDRMKLFPHLPKNIDRYQLVLDEARHSAFTDSRLPEDGLQRKNPNHHRVMLAYSTAFWDSYLKEDPAAKAWLQGEEAKSLLERRDEWQVLKQGQSYSHP